MTSPPRIFAHHMLREIYEQPAAVRDTFRHALLQPARFAATVATALASVRRVLIAASGTSRHAGIAGKFMLETLAGIPVEVDYSSELQHAPLPPGTDTLVVVITQSGETADTLAALRWARAGGAKVLAICNVADASVMREADAAIHTKAGPELAVPSTKAFTAQMAALLSFAMWLGAVRQPASLAAIERLRSEIELLPAALETVLALDKTMHGLAARYAWCTDFFLPDAAFTTPWPWTAPSS